MKLRITHIAASFFLAAAVLFSQVGLGYFHDKHDAHEHIEASQKNQTQLHKHGEHCKVCSIDLFFSLFLNGNSVDINTCQHIVSPVVLQENLKSLPLTFLKGRAPPVSII